VEAATAATAATAADTAEAARWKEEKGQRKARKRKRAQLPPPEPPAKCGAGVTSLHVCLPDTCDRQLLSRRFLLSTTMIQVYNWLRSEKALKGLPEWMLVLPLAAGAVEGDVRPTDETIDELGFENCTLVVRLAADRQQATRQCIVSYLPRGASSGPPAAKKSFGSYNKVH